MAVQIKLDPAAFGPGKKFEGMLPSKVVMSFGNAMGRDSQFTAAPVLANYTDRPMNPYAITATSDGQSVPTQLWNKIHDSDPMNLIGPLSQAVREGLVMVIKDGVTFTADQVLLNP